MLENLNGAQAACKDLATIKTTNERLKVRFTKKSTIKIICSLQWYAKLIAALPIFFAESSK